MTRLQDDREDAARRLAGAQEMLGNGISLSAQIFGVVPTFGAAIWVATRLARDRGVHHDEARQVVELALRRIYVDGEQPQ